MRSSQAVSDDNPGASDASILSAFLRQPVIHPSLCLCFTLLAALDVAFTAFTLNMGGTELNIVADWIIMRWDLPGLVAFKFSIVILIVCMVHVIARLDGRAAHRLAEWAVALTCIPVTAATAQLLVIGLVLVDRV